MSEEERPKTLLEVGFAIGAVIGCIVAGIWLASLGPADGPTFDSPDEPAPRLTHSMPPLHRDDYTVHGPPTPRATAPTRTPTAGSTSRPTRTPEPRPTREVSLPPTPPAPVGTRSPSATASPAPAAPTVCRVRVLGICLVR